MSNARFSILQSRAVGDNRISHSQFRTLAALGLYGDKDGWCFPKLDTLGAILGKSKQAVSKDIQALAELGYLEVYKQTYANGFQRNNKYRLIFDTGQPDIDPSQPDIDIGSTPEVDTASTPEVDTLTPHINDPKNNVVVDGSTPQRPNIYEIYEQEIGALSPMIAEELDDVEKDYPVGWFAKAVKEAKMSATRGVSMKYIYSILDRWKAEGLPNEYQDAPQAPKKNGKRMIQLPDGTIAEAKL